MINIGTASAARLYNISITSVENALDTLNATYGLNMDIVFLDHGDKCAGDTNFGLCATREYNDSGDLLFAMDTTQRRMESMLREGLSDYVLPKDQALIFEQGVRESLRSEDYEQAFLLYIAQLEDYLDEQCFKVGLVDCHINKLHTALQEQEQHKREKSAQTISKLTRATVRSIIGLLLFISLYFAFRSWKTYIRNRRYIQELRKNIDFLKMQIHHDKNIFDINKKELNKKLEILEKSLEDIQSQSASLMARKIKETDFVQKLQSIQTEYEDMLITIAKTDKIDEEKEQIKKTNI